MKSVFRITKLFLIVCMFLWAFQTGNSQVNDRQERGDMRIMFYNVENLFDTFDDSLKQDEEFLPYGEKYWTKYRYRDKLNNLYKVIIAVGGWKPPEIIGLAEVENRRVLEDLVRETPLVKFNYKIIHEESPDERGIDVALLYLPNSFTDLKSESFSITIPDEPNWRTRDILYVKGLSAEDDTLHLFVNHWPSRSGGQLETEKYRLITASVLRSKVEKVFSLDPDAKIVMMGDFNDNPEDPSLKEVLQAKMDFPPVGPASIYNLTQRSKKPNIPGTIKYKMEWGLFDQFIVSGNLLAEKGDLVVRKEDFHIYTARYLLITDDTYLGIKPLRTYTGFKYQNGFSDHLPVYIDLWTRIPEN